MRLAVIALTACSFTPGALPRDASEPADAAVDTVDAPLPPWYGAFANRRVLTVTTGAVAPMNGFAGYTVRLVFDSAAEIAAGSLQADCRDVRIVRDDAELPIHLLGCGTATAEIRFALVADVTAPGTDTTYAMYYGDAAVQPPPPVGTTDVYRWWDDASVDRSLQYVRGRIDSWGSTNNWTDLPTYDPAGHYNYALADDFVSGYRRAVDERDVLIEAQMRHVACFPGNMVSGLIVRGVIASGTLGTEEADHYYAALRGEQAACGAGYAFDGDIVKTVRDAPVIDGTNPGAVVPSSWRVQALAAWHAGPTQLAFWDSDTPWASPGWPTGTPNAAGADATDNTSPGFAGVWFAQDSGSFRNVLIRRYIDPEPTVIAGSVEVRTSSPPLPRSPR